MGLGASKSLTDKTWHEIKVAHLQITVDGLGLLTPIIFHDKGKNRKKKHQTLNIAKLFMRLSMTGPIFHSWAVTQTQSKMEPNIPLVLTVKIPIQG